MRQYSFGVLILLLGYTISQSLPENRDNDGSSSIFNYARDDSSSESISDDRENEYEIPGDVLRNKKIGNQIGKEFVNDDFVSENDKPEDDVAYWESIYGTEDVPEFEIPPDIAGETIFVELDDLMADHEAEAEEDVQLQRGIRKIKSHFVSNIPPANNGYGESPESYSNLGSCSAVDYRGIATDVYQPNFYGHRNSARNSKTSSAFERNTDGQFYGPDVYSGTVNSPNIKRREEESLGEAEIEASDDINWKVEGNSAKQFPLALESRSIKSRGLTDSLVDFKRKKIQAKKELVDALISSKMADFDHIEGFSATSKTHSSKNTRSRTRTRTKISSKSSVHQSALESERKIISTEEDSTTQDIASGDSKTGLTNAITRALDAKRERVEPGVSDGESEIYYERELGHGGVEDFGSDTSLDINDRNEGSAAYGKAKKIAVISTDSRHRDPFQSVLDSKRKVIEAEKDLIHTAGMGGSKAELASAIIRKLEAKKDLIDSVKCSKAEIFQNIKQSGHSTCHTRETAAEVEESEMQSSMQNGHRHNGDSRPCSQHRHESVINSKVTKIQNSESSHHSSTTGTSNFVVAGEIRTTDKLRDVDHDGEDTSSTVKKEVDIDDQITANLGSSLNTRESGGESSYSGKTDKSERTFINEMKTVDHTKSSVDSTAGERDLKDEFAENYELSNADEERDISVNENGHVQASGQISTHEKTSLSKSQSESKLFTSAIRIDSTNTKSKQVKFATGVTTIQDLKSGLITSQSGNDASVTSDRINLDVVKEKETELAAARYREAPHVSIEEKTSVASSCRKCSKKKEDFSGSSDSQLLQDAKCTPERCGISGKLHIASESTDENENLQEKLTSETIAESELVADSDVGEEDDKIIRVEIRPSVTEESQIVATDSQQEKFDIEKEKGDHSNWNKGEEVREDDNEQYNEEKKETDERPVIKNKQTKTIITATKNIAVSDDSVSESIVIKTPNREKIPNKTSGENEEEIHQDEFEEANDHHHEWQDTKKLSHLKNFAQFSHHQNVHENSEFYGTCGILSNDANCRLINLDVNCSGNTAFMNPECQQLNTYLQHPQDSSMSVTLRTVKTYLNHGQELAIEMHNRAKWLCEKGYIPKLHTPAMLHLINNLANEKTVEINQKSEFSLFGTKLLQSNCFSEYDVTPNTFLEFLQHHSFRVVGNGLCHVRPKRCQGDQIYRTFDGSCNNKEHPTWGRVNTAFSRILPARYFDGIHELAKSVTGSELPNPRVISVHCFSHKSIKDNKLTLAITLWGQLLAHDFTMQIPDQTTKGGIICCADEKRQLPKSLQHHSCLPIDIPSNDKFYSKFGARCMEFVRSMTVGREDCTLGPAEQLNTVTAYLDSSPLYGSDKETCDRLRAFEGGRMLVSHRRGRELLPVTSNRSIFCDIMSPSEVCYSAGDLRVNQIPQLAILHTLLLREHNRIADKLSQLNPHWSDERVFQETRRIVLAEYQFITYNEWLPLIIGKKYCRKYKIAPQFNGGKTSQDYDPRIKANTINEFAAAAYRFFHSMVEGNINLCPMNRDITHRLRLSNYFFRPQVIERNDNFDCLVRGMVTQTMQKSDDNFHPEVTEYLFRSKNPFGFDLLTLDIQRGRDHGMRCYNDYRKICGLKRAKNFDDLKGEIPLESIEKLKSIYANVDDIDLVVGIGLEKKCRGSILGPVARCLVGEQFYRSKIGDRYFHDNQNQPYPFTQEQLDEIRKASFAKLLCNTADNLEDIQPEAFKIISHINPLISCNSLSDIDLSAWQESKCD